MRNWLGKQTNYFVLYILLSGESVSIDSRALRDTIRSSTSQGSADSDPSDTNPGNSTDTALTSTLRRYEAAKWSEESLLTADYGSAGSAAGGTAGGPLWDRDFLVCPSKRLPSVVTSRLARFHEQDTRTRFGDQL